MDYYETRQGAKVRVLLTNEELQFTAIDELCDKYRDWLRVSKECGGRTTRKTRSANRKTDLLYDEILAFKVPPIKLKQLSSIIVPQPSSNPPRTHSTDTSIDTDSDSSSTRPITRSLRPRSRTPTITNQQQSTRQITAPCTPQHQRIRAHMKQQASGSNGGSSVLGTALAQGHPKVSVTKIKQVLKFTESAQKKRDEEKERQARLIQERKVKEERAEAQKRQLLEERAENAKQNREKRLNHAAELRKAREEAKAQLKLRELEARKAQAAMLLAEEKANQLSAQAAHQDQQQFPPTAKMNQDPKLTEKPPTTTASNDLTSLKKPKIDAPSNDIIPSKTQVPAQKMNETFKKPSDDVNNIDISIQDETNDEIQKEKVQQTAVWARAPHLREALIAQFSKPDDERHQEVLKVFPGVQLPVELDKIFGSGKAVNTRYLCRTSSAVWSPPNRALKRSSSAVMTPTNN